MTPQATRSCSSGTHGRGGPAPSPARRRRIRPLPFAGLLGSWAARAGARASSGWHSPRTRPMRVIHRAKPVACCREGRTRLIGGSSRTAMAAESVVPLLRSRCRAAARTPRVAGGRIGWLEIDARLVPGGLPSPKLCTSWGFCNTAAMPCGVAGKSEIEGDGDTFHSAAPFPAYSPWTTRCAPSFRGRSACRAP